MIGWDKYERRNVQVDSEDSEEGARDHSQSRVGNVKPQIFILISLLHE
jgi:hypothetical protein